MTAVFVLLVGLTTVGLAEDRQAVIVVGPAAPELERFAAQEMAGQLKRLFDASVQVRTEVPEQSENLVVLGSPATNPAVAWAAGEGWPKLTDQGHLLRSVERDGRPVLIVGGASPAATLWASYELGHRFGIRYLLSGDVFPAEPGPMKLDGFDVVLEPALRTRTWRTINDFAIGPESWGLEEHRRVLAQLAKLKFNRVLLTFYPWQPFVHYEFGGVKKQTAMLWYGYRYPVDGDTAGRTAFAGAKEFTNPDFVGKNTYKEMTAAGVGLARGIISEAKRLGMSVGIAISPLEFPREFAAALPEAKVLHGLGSLTIGPGPRQPPDDPLIRDLVKTKIRAYLDTYPEIDALYLTLPEFPDWVEHYEQAWNRLDARYGVGKVNSLEQLTQQARDRQLIASGDRGVRALRGNLAALDFFSDVLADSALLRTNAGRQVQPVVVDADPALFAVLDRVLPEGTGALHFVDYTARRVAANRQLLADVPTGKMPSSLILTLADDNVGVLPQLATGDHHTLLADLRKYGWDGFSTRYWLIGDLDPSVYYLSRASFDASTTPASACDALITPMCGPGVSERFNLALEKIERATHLIDENDLGFAFPVPGMVMKHYATSAPPPAWWGEARELYTQAMVEVYRAHDRSLAPGRPLLFYYAKRLEFAVEYLTSIEALRQAAQAKAAGESEEVVSHLESAVEAMYNGTGALGEVARSNSDRGLIAVLNEYGYRPLQREFEAQLKAAE
jgi:hypothetical protein